MPSIDEQVIDLQTRIAYQDDTLSQLNDIVAAQQREIDRLRAAVDNLSRLVQDDSSARPGEAGADEKPPHY